MNELKPVLRAKALHEGDMIHSHELSLADHGTGRELYCGKPWSLRWDLHGFVSLNADILLYGLDLDGMAEIHFPEESGRPHLWRRVRVRTEEGDIAVGVQTRVTDAETGLALPTTSVRFEPWADDGITLRIGVLALTREQAGKEMLALAD